LWGAFPLPFAAGERFGEVEEPDDHRECLALLASFTAEACCDLRSPRCVEVDGVKTSFTSTAFGGSPTSCELRAARSPSRDRARARRREGGPHPPSVIDGKLTAWSTSRTSGGFADTRGRRDVDARADRRKPR
jgi:hypothetical protein